MQHKEVCFVVRFAAALAERGASCAMSASCMRGMIGGVQPTAKKNKKTEMRRLCERAKPLAARICVCVSLDASGGISFKHRIRGKMLRDRLRSASSLRTVRRGRRLIKKGPGEKLARSAGVRPFILLR